MKNDFSKFYFKICVKLFSDRYSLLFVQNNFYFTKILDNTTTFSNSEKSGKNDTNLRKRILAKCVTPFIL